MVGAEDKAQDFDSRDPDSHPDPCLWSGLGNKCALIKLNVN